MDKNLIIGSTTMLILRLLEDEDKYGYQMIEELTKKSDDTFTLKAGTLYPLLHNLERQGMVYSYDKTVGTSKVRKYYAITKSGKGLLLDKKAEWISYSRAINKVLEGDAVYASI